MKHIVEEAVLNNGARGLLIHVPSATVMSYDFEFRAGTDYVVSRDISETAHIMEHMAIGANRKYPNSRQFSAEFEKNGAYHNAHTSSASLKYVVDCADFEWDRILEMLRLAITEPLFLAEEFKAEYGNVKEELTGYLNNNGRVLWQRISQASGESFLNDEQALKAMPNVKLSHIKEHYKRTHTSDNMRFVIAGNLKGDRKEQIVNSLEKWNLPRGERFGLIREELVGALEPVHVFRKDVESLIFGLDIQVNWRLNDDEVNSVSALNHLLTGTLHSSILGRAREKGLAYDISSGCITNETASEWYFGGGVSLKNAPGVYKIMIEELKKVLDGDIPTADVEAAKSYALGKYQMGCQTVGSIANWYTRRYFFDGYIDSYSDGPAKISSLNKATMVRVARELIGGKRWAFGGLGNVTAAQLKDLHTQLNELFC
jgi:predicted Zn-dependent peptidase